MPFGDAPKEQFLLFFVAYLMILSLILTFLISAMQANYAMNIINIPIVKDFNIGNVGSLFTLFTTLFLWYVPETLLPIYIQLPFTIFPKLAIGVVLLSYIKDML